MEAHKAGRWARLRSLLLERRFAERLALAFLLLGGLLVVVWGVKIVRVGLSLQTHLAAVQALAEGDPLAVVKTDPQSLGELLREIRSDVKALRAVRGLAQLGPALGWLPEVGPLLAQSVPLLDLADGLTEAGVLMWEGYQPLLIDWQTGRLSMEGAAVHITSGAPYAAAARRPVQRALAAWELIDPATLPDRLQGPLAQLEAVLPWLEDGLALAESAPELLGMTEPRTYLLLALNEDELRPGGGFITAVGEVRIASGEILGLEFRDSYAVDDFSQPYPLAPDPLQRFMGIQLWTFRDSNWSPDFPTSVEVALPLYRPPNPATVAGVAALDQHAVRRLIGAFSPLTVEGVERQVTGENVVAFMQEAWAPEDGVLDREWWQQRKAFMGDVAGAILARVESGAVDWSQLALALSEVLDQKHMVIYVGDPEVTQVLHRRGWDGAMTSPVGDYLLLAEANVGYNKATPRIRRLVRYEVDLTSETPLAQLQVTYTHTGQVAYPCKPELRYDPVYEAMMDRCYWAYLQFFAPAGLQLLEASVHPIPAEAVWTQSAWEGTPVINSAESGYMGLEQAVLLAPGASTVVSFTYELPVSILDREAEWVAYQLDFQKQPGTAGLSYEIALHLPENAVSWLAQPEPALVSGKVLIFKGEMVRDLIFRVQYQEEGGALP
ncbi:MAG: DUF4012 domain-containing protein [Anaerolineae bacterium]|nr:DUF4012 domain-containing protein [Anaerolineae bacterium]